MTKYSRLEIQMLAFECKTTLESAISSSEILDLLTQHGYDQQKLQDGIKEAQHLQAVNEQQQDLYAQKVVATADFKAARKEVDWLYGKLYASAKKAIKADANRLNLLKTYQVTAGVYDARRAALDRFFRLLQTDPAISAGLLAEPGTGAQLQAAIQGLKQTEVLRDRRDQLNQEAKQATQTQKALAAALDVWLENFWGLARAALAERPELLEELGKIKVEVQRRRKSEPQAEAEAVDEATTPETSASSATAPAEMVKSANGTPS